MTGTVDLPGADPGRAAASADITTAEIQGLIWETLSGAAVSMLGPPNVVMQLARLPVGHGVAKSKVESGRADLHPFKRARTTFSYLTVAMLGTDPERRAYRDEVNRSHRLVRSEPDDEVAYNAFDAELQMWVAACLYVGAEQSIDLFFPGRLDRRPGLREAFYCHCSRLGATLQVPEQMWPASRDAFERYWQENLAKVEMDDVSRTYLLKLISLANLPVRVPRVVGRLHRFIVTGFLPEPFRDELGLSWSAAQARRHAMLARAVAAIARATPGPIRRFPLNAFHRDTQRRISAGRPIV